MCSESVLVPIPDLLADYRDRPWDPTWSDAEFGILPDGTKCFRIDACIAEALTAVWAAGMRTTGCCCGHGQESGGVISVDTSGRGREKSNPLRGRYEQIHREATA